MTETTDGSTTTTHAMATDVRDFAWAAGPRFVRAVALARRVDGGGVQGGRGSTDLTSFWAEHRVEG